MRQVIIIPISVLLSISILSAQQTINTDRPDQSDGVYILEKKRWQIEEGVLFAKAKLLNNLMLRYGITHSMEIRLLIDCGKENDLIGLLPVSLSMKQRIYKGEEIIPAVSVIGYVSSDYLATKNFSNKEWNYNVVLAFENEVSDNFSVGYNVTTTSFCKDISVTCNLGYSVLKNLSYFVEYFVTFEKHNIPEHNFDVGLLYSCLDNFQVDIATGNTFNTMENYFITAGFAYKF
jgi:hypothetical protein